MHERLGQRRVAQRAPCAVSNSFELVDGASQRLGRLGEHLALHVHDSQVDQAAADLLDVSDPFGELEAAYECVRRFVETPELAVGIADDPQRRGQSALIVVLLEDVTRLVAVRDGVLELPLQGLRTRELQEEACHDRRPA